MPLPEEQSSGYLSDEMYDLVYSHTPRLCVDVVVYAPEKGIILTRRSIEPQLGVWHIPGGRVRHQETLSVACQRLISKEVGVTYGDMLELGTMQFLNEKLLSTGAKTHSVSVGFLAPLLSGEPRACDEGEEVAWFTELPAKDTMDPVHHDFLAKHWPTIQKHANL